MSVCAFGSLPTNRRRRVARNVRTTTANLFSEAESTAITEACANTMEVNGWTAGARRNLNKAFCLGGHENFRVFIF